MKKNVVKDKTVVVPVKMKQWEKNILKESADRYAGGNLSAWLRYAAFHYNPHKGKKWKDV